jgi:thioredoxin reductase
MSPSSNQRTDKYGGSMDNRLRFPLEVIDAIRDKVGYDFVVGFRLAGDEMAEGGNNSEYMKQIAMKLTDTGKLDYIHTGLPFYEGIFKFGFGMHLPQGLYTPYAAGFKEVLDLPVINNFRINDPVHAEKILANGQADLVGMTRALIADPELPNKAMQGKLDEIRYCIGCDQGCFGRIYQQIPMSCLQNAAVGLEKEIGTIEPAPAKKKILVAGGGPSGMETARVARLRGHDVVLYEKEQQLGGMVNVAAKAPYRDEFGVSVRYLIKQMEILGVKVHLGTEATVEIIEQERPDAVIVATGSSLFMPDIPGLDQDNVVTVIDVLEQKVEVGEKVVVVDGGESHWQCCSTAEYLIEKGKKVEMVTPFLFPGNALAITTDLVPYLFRVRSQNMVFHTSSALLGISGSTVICQDIYANTENRIEEVDTVVYVARGKANNPLYHSLKGKIKELYMVGDALAPRKALDAIHDGYKLGRII